MMAQVSTTSVGTQGQALVVGANGLEWGMQRVQQVQFAIDNID